VRQADRSSRGVLPNVFVSLGVIGRTKDLLDLRRGGRRSQTKKEIITLLFSEVTGLGHRAECEKKNGGESAKISMEVIVPLWLSNITKILVRLGCNPFGIRFI
jgi:hypothetical protein